MLVIISSPESRFLDAITLAIVKPNLLFTGKKYFCVLSQFHQQTCLGFSSEACMDLEVLHVSKGLKEAGFLGATFLLGLAALEAPLHFTGF